ncbi:MAG: DUF2064 domain-containing protein [Halobacteriales archaeon]
MTIHAVLLDPPHPEFGLAGFADGTPLSPAEAAALYAAATKDTLRAVAASGGSLLVNHRDPDDVPAGAPDPEASARELAASALEDPEAARFEVQVGSTFEARAGNTATHLLGEEDADSVAVLDGTVPGLTRTTLDEAAMKLRRHGVVVGPAPGGRVAYLGLSRPVDFEGAYGSPALESVTRNAVEADRSVAFLASHGRIDRPGGLASVVAEVRARRSADRPVPAFTAARIEEWGLRVEHRDGEAVVLRE